MTWSPATQDQLDKARSVAGLREAWAPLEAAGRVDGLGGSEYHHALAHLRWFLEREGYTREDPRGPVVPDGPVVHKAGAVRPFAACGSYSVSERHARDAAEVTCRACLDEMGLS